jgi:formylglycine-generating enzyme required for sulfatase activity
MGRDKYGLWAEFTIERNAAKPVRKRAGRKKRGAPPDVTRGAVRQRLRWIPPGRFLMGSPDDKTERFAWEQHQHEVTISEGFWMFDTPCTQALWESLMGGNPSEFLSPNRPVENVSWHDCRDFLQHLKDQCELPLALPSEAQWEYACRAGTTTATYAGPLRIIGVNNAPILDAIAWYGGNSGIDYELNNGYSAAKWPEKQYEFPKAGTHTVARKKANPWGLYDMLGNVWEWCEDLSVSGADRDSRAEPRRVIRGGSWTDDGLHVRAAYRYRYIPQRRNHRLGFRCAEFRQGS